VIGSGIFIITGTAAAGESFHFESVLHAPILDLLRHGTETTFMTGRLGAGQGVALSFLITAIVCGFAALGYGELASMIPIAGSAYTYAYGWLGEIVAWMIGWDLILECAVSNMAVAVGSRPISTTAGRLVWTALAGAAGGAISSQASSPSVIASSPFPAPQRSGKNCIRTTP